MIYIPVSYTHLFGGFLGVDLVFSEYGFAGIVINPGGGLGADFHTYTPTTNTI